MKRVLIPWERHYAEVFEKKNTESGRCRRFRFRDGRDFRAGERVCVGTRRSDYYYGHTVDFGEQYFIRMKEIMEIIRRMRWNTSVK